jgi:hypothetical protein
MFLTQIQVVLHGIVQYFEQLHDVGVMKLLQNRYLSVNSVQWVRR